MLKIEDTGQHGYMVTRNAQKVLETEKLAMSLARKPSKMVTSKHE